MIQANLLAGTPERVQIVIPGADLPAGAAWSLAWEVNGFTGTPRGGYGVGAGEQVVIVDAACPVGAPVTYTLHVGGAVSSSVTVTRTFGGGSILADLSAEAIVGFGWYGDDSREGTRRVHVSDVPGSRRPPMRYAPPGDGGGSLTAVTTRPATDGLRRLLASGEPLLLLHNLADCQIPGCDVPPSEMVYVTSDGNARTGAVAAAERAWALSYLLAADPEPGWREPTSTWDSFDAAALTWDQLDAMALTWDEFDRTDWGQVGA